MPTKKDFALGEVSQGQFCLHCGAWRGDLGLEPTPEVYLDHMMQVMGEVWRVLRNDGICMVNIGDSYSANRGYQVPDSKHIDVGNKRGMKANEIGIKAKSLCLIPQRFAIRCQEAGWIIRSEIIWAKPNPMPESVKDRPTRSHEQVWMMTKQGKYYWDQDAVRENFTDERMGNPGGGGQYVVKAHQEGLYGPSAQTGLAKGIWTKGKEQGGRNIRDVWSIATQPFPDAHFAVFPEKLVKPCILAATKEGNGVLDPFAGAGTVGVVAVRYKRRYVLIELSYEYIKMIAKRILA